MQRSLTRSAAQGLLGRRPCRAAPRAGERGRPRRSLQVLNAVVARWFLDIKYGHKQEATALLQEWVREVGARAGLSTSNTRIFSGAIGAPESRLEMEVAMDSLAAWEAFLATVPVKEHRAWSQRIKGMVVDGSPQWQVFHSLPLTAEAAPQQASSSISLGGQPQQAKSAAGANDGQLLLDLGAILSYPSVVGGGSAPGVNDSNSWMAGPAGAAASSKPSADAASGKPDAKDSTASGDAVLDWKGEPMKINPGDKLPFKFL